MNGTGREDREKPHGDSGRNSAPASGDYADSIFAAAELLDALKEEMGILRRFAGDELVGFLPKKETLINELRHKLAALEGPCGEHAPGAGDARDRLKAMLRKAQELNASNHHFISRTLSYWQDFLSALFPRNYGPVSEPMKPFAAGTKGLAFSREV